MVAMIKLFSHMIQSKYALVYSTKIASEFNYASVTSRNWVTLFTKAIYRMGKISLVYKIFYKT